MVFTSTSYTGFLAREPLFWATVAGLFTGLAFGCVLRPWRRAAAPERARTRRLAIAAIFFSVAVAAAASGVILPPGLSVLTIQAAIAAGVGVVLGTVSGRFPFGVAIPLLVVAGAAVLLAGSLLEGLMPVRATESVAAVSVLSLQDDSVTFELLERTGGSEPLPRIVTAPDLAADVAYVDLSEAYFLLGAYRFAAVRIVPDDPRFEPSGLLSEALARGWLALESASIQAPPLNLLQRYQLLLSPDRSPAFDRLR